MKTRTLLIKLYALTAAGSTLFAFRGCGLSDQQWATVWQAVITSGLSTVVNTTLSGLAGAGA
ncbi:MAG: hypothetical protein IPM18_03210 [Phycisphaerales bacterium]|nr:hypothetical protein [Phycisphaerales bacterium]